MSEVDSDRSLHHARSTSAGSCSKACRLAERRIFSLSYDSTDAAVGVRHRAQTELQTSVDVPEIRVIEYIVYFPTQLDLAPLTQANVFEERQIIVEDRGHPNEIPAHVADVSQAGWVGEAADINHVGHSRRICARNSLHWIAGYLGSCID